MELVEGKTYAKAKACADLLIQGLVERKERMQPNLYSVEEIIRIAEQNTTGKPAMYRAFGLEPNAFDLLVIKANTSFRAPFAPISDQIYVANTPGAGASNLLQFQWKNVSKKHYPFSEPKPTPAELW